MNRAFVLSGLLSAWPSVASDQRVAPPCTYDTCALRLEGAQLLRGAPPGVTVGRLGVWSAPRLSALVAASDSAAAYAAVFDRDYVTGQRVAILGAIGFAALSGLLLTLGRDSPDRGVDAVDWAFLGASLAVAGVSLYGNHRVQRARAALPRALWWYNRDLPR